jgi:hypothetical protein
MFQQLLLNFGQSMEVTVSVSSLLCIKVHADRNQGIILILTLRNVISLLIDRAGRLSYARAKNAVP